MIGLYDGNSGDERLSQERDALRARAEAAEAEVSRVRQISGLWCEHHGIVDGCGIFKVEVEVARLKVRLGELHQAMVKITRETPYPGEVEDDRARVGVLTARVATLTRERDALLRGRSDALKGHE